MHHPDHVERVVEKIRHCFNHGEAWEDTFPLRGRDGHYRWFLARAFPIHDDRGRVVQWFGTNTDITEQLEAEAAVQASEAQLRLVTDHASVFLLQCDREHRFKFVNRPYAARFGLEPQHIIGARIPDIIGADAYALIQPHIAAALEGQRVEFDIELPFEQLGRRWMHVVYVPEWAPYGDVIGFVGILIDLSRRKWAEEALRDSEERLKLALAGADMGVWTWDVDTGAVYWSQEVYRLFGTDAFDGTAEAFTRFVHPDDVSSVWHTVYEALANKTLYSTEFRMVQPNGSVRWMSTRGRADYTPDGQPVRMLGIVLDITDRKLAEQEVERARDEALAAARAKDDFLAALSHELRTPLNPVLLLASEAANNPQLPPEVRADFDTIAKNVALEARLIDDLLDLTQITRGKLVLDPDVVDVHAVLRDAVTTVQTELQQKQLGLSCAFEAEAHTVLGDATRLQQVFWNVLKNAVKFTPEAGKIRIETRTCTASGTLNVRVVDTGIGMSPEELERVFNAFSQGDHALRITN
jgi:PAS domain S-box-containing protein